MLHLNPLALIQSTLLILALLFAVSPNVGSAQTKPAVESQLNWKNGDSLPGVAVQGDNETLRWQANLFRDPLNIDLTYLDRIKFNSISEYRQTDSTYSIQTVDGFSLYGEIKELNDDHLVLVSDRFGEIKVLREKVATILNLKTSGSLINGEFNLDKWDANRNEKKYWTVNDQGELQSRRSNVHLFMRSELPDSAMIEVELEWDKKLDFIFGFGVPKNSRKIESLPRLESWDGPVVLVYGEDEFEIVADEVGGESKRLKFLIHWNRKTNDLIIHDERGKQLATANLGDTARDVQSGIYIENKSGDLKLTSLMIRRSSVGFDATAASIQTVADAAVNGVVKSFDGENWAITPTGEDEEEVKLGKDDFCGAFRINPATERPSGQTKLKFQDGMFVRGKFVSLEGESVTLETDFIAESLSLKLAGATSLRFDSAPNDKTEDFTHRLINKVGEIQGRLEQGTGTADDVLRWRVAGAKDAVPFSSGDAKIVLQKKAPLVDVDEKWADTLYLSNRDTVPCRVISMDENQISVESFFQNEKIDQKLVKAVDLRTQVFAEKVEPDGKEWAIPDKFKKLVKQSEDKLALSKGAEFGHPWMFATGGFEFELKWKPNFYGVLECRTLLGDVGSDEGGKKVNVMMYGENIFVGNPGETDPNSGMISANGGKAKLAFKYQKGKMLVSINGKQVYSENVNSSTNRGRGIQFKLNDMYQQGIKCELKNFSLLFASTGNSSLVDEDQKRLLLTIPRLKKKNPPKQILCATNLDMLRGELISLDDKFVMFRANHEEKRFPRHVVSSVVWLQAEGLSKRDDEDESAAAKPDETDDKDKTQVVAKIAAENAPADIESPESSSDAQTVQVLMLGNRRMTATLSSWTDEGLSGESKALGECKIPFDQIYELRFGSFATTAMDVPYSNWIAELAPAPKMETGTGTEPGSEFLFGSSSLLIGTQPKSFSLPTVEGDPFVLSKQRGKVVVLDFWATWCGPCVKAMPGIAKTIAEYPSDEVVLMAVNLEETKAQVREFLTARELEVPVCLDADGAISRKFQVKNIPQTVIIDQQGRVAFVKVGSSNDLEEKLKAALDHLIIQDLATEN